MLQRTLCASLVLSIGLGLVACGSSSSGNNGNGGTGGETGRPSPTLATLYDGWGVRPADLGASSLHFDDAAAPAVAPGYLALATLQAMTDVRMNMQNFEWSAREMVRSAFYEHGRLQEGQAYAVSCDLRSEPEADGFVGTGEALIHYQPNYADGVLDGGDEVLFSLQDCRPSGGMQAMSSSEPLRLVYGQNRYQLAGLSSASYQGLRFGSSGWLVRSDHAGSTPCDADPVCGQMSFENFADDSAASDFTLEQAGVVQPLQIRFWSDGNQPQRGTIATFVEPAQRAMTFSAQDIPAHFEPGAVGSADRAGRYVFSTDAADDLVLQYRNRSFATNRFRILAGGFSVQTPQGEIFYYRVGSDPEYLIVTNGEGEHLGTISQDLITQRLRLAE